MTLSGELMVVDFAPAHQDAAAELINANLGARFDVRDDSQNPDLFDIAASYRDACFLVGLLGGELVATGALLTQSAGPARIVRMHTAPQHRRCGFAARIVCELERRAVLRGVAEIVLDTELAWEDAQAFYERAGYVEYARDAFDVRYRKRLKP